LDKVTSKSNNIVFQAGNVKEGTIRELGLIKASPPKVQQATWHQFGGVQGGLEFGEDALGWGLEQIKLASLLLQILLDEFHHILHFLLRTKCALKDVAIRELDSNLSACMVRQLGDPV